MYSDEILSNTITLDVQGGQTSHDSILSLPRPSSSEAHRNATKEKCMHTVASGLQCWPPGVGRCDTLRIVQCNYRTPCHAIQVLQGECIPHQNSSSGCCGCRLGRWSVSRGRSTMLFAHDVTVPSTLGLPPFDRRGYQSRGRPNGAGWPWVTVRSD
jgi:hypothetical protein